MERTRLIAHPAMPATSTGGGGCLVLFALPFIAVGTGVLLASQGVFHLEMKSSSGPTWMLAAFGSVFACAGLGVAWMGISGMLRARAAANRKEEHPTEPWFWDYPWDTRRAESGGLGGALQAFAMFAFLAVFLSMFNWWAFFSDEGPLPVKLFIGFFDLIAVLVLLGALYSLFQYFKYGTSRFHFARFPFRPGSSLEGGLEASRRVLGAPSIGLTLRFIEEVTETHGTGKNRSTNTVLYCLHEIKQDLNASQFDSGSSEAEIPITIRLPAGEEYANRLLESPRRYWELEVKAETPGIDYAARFLIPVY
ncbi:MAG: hypothetical protein ABI565_12640 [Vicinamibacteria bacterium]